MPPSATFTPHPPPPCVQYYFGEAPLSPSKTYRASTYLADGEAAAVAAKKL